MKKYCFILIGLIVAAYIPALFSDFIYDDYYMVVDNTLIRSLTPTTIGSFFQGTITSEPIPPGMYRPLLMISYSLDYLVGRGSAVAYHLSSLSLHIVNCLLFLYILITLFNQKPTGAFLGTLLFALHPINTQAVNFIAAKGDVLVATLLLIAFLCYGKEKLLLAAGTFVVALLIKETAVIFLPLIIAFDLLCRKRRRLFFYGIVAAVIIGYFIGRHSLYGAFVSAYKHRSVEKNTLLMVQAILFSIGLWFIPLKLSIVHMVRGFTFFEYAGVAAVAAAVGVLVRKKVDRKVLFGAAWFCIPLGILFFGSFSSPVSEHRLYLSGMGMALVLSVCGVSKQARRVLVGVIMIFFVMTLARNVVWSDTVSLWKSAVHLYPESAVAHDNLAQEYQEREQLAAALTHYQESVRINPAAYKPYYNIGVVYGQQGMLEKAVTYFQKSIEREPSFGPAYNNLGISYLAIAHPQPVKARQALLKAKELGFPVHPKIMALVEGVEQEKK